MRENAIYSFILTALVVLYLVGRTCRFSISSRACLCASLRWLKCSRQLYHVRMQCKVQRGQKCNAYPLLAC